MTAPFFAPNETVFSTRLQLSALDPALIESLPWLDAALAPDWTVADLNQAVETHPGVLISDPDAYPVGLAVVQVDTPEPGAVSFLFLAIDPVRRFRGLGGEAGLIIERHIRARLGTTRFYAPIPDGRGLAVYFWLRLGYRPLVQLHSPGPLIGLTAIAPAGIWMLRDTT
jgi:hypothetical protein